MRRDPVGRHAHVAVSKQLNRSRHKSVRVAVDSRASPDEAVGVGRCMLVAKRRKSRHDLDGNAERSDCVAERRRPDLAVGNDLDAGEMVRPEREHPAVLERKPERVLPHAAHVPVRGLPRGEAHRTPRDARRIRRDMKHLRKARQTKKTVRFDACVSRNYQNRTCDGAGQRGHRAPKRKQPFADDVDHAQAQDNDSKRNGEAAQGKAHDD